MPQKKTSKVKAYIRIDSKLESEARRIARRDYGDEKHLSPVVEDALTKYIAREEASPKIEALLSATEGALYDRIGKKVEKEVHKLLERIGDITAKSSFETILNGYMLKALFLSNPKFKQEDYEKLRQFTAQRMKRNYGIEEVPSLVEENKNLSNQVAKLEKDIEKIKLEYEEKLREKENELVQKGRIIDQVSQHFQGLIKYIQKHETRSFTGKPQLEKPLEQLVKEYKETIERR